MHFTNRRYFLRQKIEIKQSSLLVNKKTLFEETEYEISFEQLDSKKKTEIKTNSNMFFTGVFFFVFGAFFLSGSIVEIAAICVAIAFLLITVSFIDKRRIMTIAAYNGDNLVLYFTSRNREEVNDFIDKILKAANSFLLNKYNKIDKALPIEPQLDNIQFLRNREIISEEEYELLKDQLFGRDNKSYIGFSNNN
jgi:hypothetical protein